MALKRQKNHGSSFRVIQVVRLGARSSAYRHCGGQARGDPMTVQATTSVPRTVTTGRICRRRPNFRSRLGGNLRKVMPCLASWGGNYAARCISWPIVRETCVRNSGWGHDRHPRAFRPARRGQRVALESMVKARNEWRDLPQPKVPRFETSGRGPAVRCTALDTWRRDSFKIRLTTNSGLRGCRRPPRITPKERRRHDDQPRGAHHRRDSSATCPISRSGNNAAIEYRTRQG